VATPTGQEDHGDSDVTVLCVLACNLDSVNGGRIQQYMFEPEYSEEELPRDEDICIWTLVQTANRQRHNKRHVECCCAVLANNFQQ